MKRRFILLALTLAACTAPSAGVFDRGSTNDTDPPKGDSGSKRNAATDASADGSAASVSDAAKEASPLEPPPTPFGCVTDVSTGQRTYSCEGLGVLASIPAQCQSSGCGLVLEIHGDTGNGALMDAHTQLMAAGRAKGYIVLSPTGPPFGGTSVGSTWRSSEDAKLVRIVRTFAQVFRVNDRKIHATGFSRGGFVAWRLVCDASDLFASVAPAAAGDGSANSEVTCFAGGRSPARKPDILFLVGRTDTPVPYATMTRIRDNALADYGLTARTVVTQDAKFTHSRWTKVGGPTIEVFEHDYETDPTGPWANARGHCFPGSTVDPQAPQYAVPCKAPNGFVWGEEVMTFFEAHPKR